MLVSILKNMKIAFTSTNLITCGGIITVFEYVSRLKKLGYEADIYAESGNSDLESTYNIHHRPLSDVFRFADDADSVIIAVRWEQCELFKDFKSKKYQFVQGNDLLLLGESEREKCIESRNDTNWKLIGVSRYCLEPWKRGIIIQNGVNERFSSQYNQIRDIEVLVEGNNEPNKNIPEAIELAKKLANGKKIVWLGRETHTVEGVEAITNPPQEEIPKIYQRAKYFIKLSKSEGFCLPILEAMASGCLVITRPMGGNDFCDYGMNCYSAEHPMEYIRDEQDQEDIIKNAQETAKGFSWQESVASLLQEVQK